MPADAEAAREYAAQLLAEPHHSRCNTNHGGECDCYKRRPVYALAAELDAARERETQQETQRRDWRDALKAWGLGDTDAMQAIMLRCFLREFGRAPVPDAASVSGAAEEGAE